MYERQFEISFSLANEVVSISQVQCFPSEDRCRHALEPPSLSLCVWAAII